MKNVESLGERSLTNTEAASGHVRAEKAAPTRLLIGRRNRRRPAISRRIGRPIQQPSFSAHPHPHTHALTHPREVLVSTGAGRIQEKGQC